MFTSIVASETFIMYDTRHFPVNQGKVAEWFNAIVSEAIIGQPITGSNPVFPAINNACRKKSKES